MKFAFLMYHGVEPIDLAAIGVISMARRVMPELSYLTVAATHDLQIFSNGLRVAPDVTFAQCPTQGPGTIRIGVGGDDHPGPTVVGLKTLGGTRCRCA